MKKALFFVLSAVISMAVIAQERAAVNASLKNVAVTKSLKITDDVLPSQTNPTEIVQAGKSMYFGEIGKTEYDLMTNASTDQRIHLYADGTIGVTFTYGTGANFPDRGTGYVYFDGTSWSAIPTERIEGTTRTGWPSYSALGANGEVVVAHDGTNGVLVMNKRDTKGTGSWVSSTLASPSGVAAAWPRICTDGNTIHVIAGDQESTLAGQLNPFMYYRSLDGGTTWDKNGIQLPGLTGTEYPQGFGGDVYTWAEPKGDTIAFVIGDNWTDLILMKSLDAGETWTKTNIFTHPYPNWTDAVLTPDTPYVADGACAIALDENGKAHVAFGLMRVLNETAGDDQSSWFPLVDGLAYWEEGDPTFTSLDPEDVDAAGKLIGWTLDLDASGTLWDDLTAVETQVASYYVSPTSMPQLSFDENGTLYCVFKMLSDTMHQGAGDDQYFSRIYARKLPAGSTTWSDFSCLTGGIDFDMSECVFPAMAKNVDGKLHMWFMMDAEPGLSVRGDKDAQTSNSIIYMNIDTVDVGSASASVETMFLNEVMDIYPNPATDNLNISFNTNTSSDYVVSIISVLGDVVRSYNMKSNGFDVKTINISDLPTGIYMVQVSNEKGSTTKKLIKN